MTETNPPVTSDTPDPVDDLGHTFVVVILAICLLVMALGIVRLWQGRKRNHATTR